ncbi:wings apart-like protein regulation of heterochromatin-domain-containing protein [Aspergillus spectabilis]
MPQNKKRPVTYGKSPLNRLEPYVPGLDTSTKTSRSRTPRKDSSAAIAALPPVSSVRLAQPRSPKNPEQACSSPSQAEDENSAMQRKRRKLSPEETSHDYSGNKLNLHAAVGGNPVDLDLHDNRDIPSNVSCRNGSETLQFSPSMNASEAKSVNRVQSSYGRSARRQKPISQPRDHDHRNLGDPHGTARTDESASTRKRLIDSLGIAVGESRKALNPESDDAPASAHPFPGDILDQTASSPTHGLSPRRLSESKMRHVERSQRILASPIPRVMLRSPGVTYSRQRSFLNESIGLTDHEPNRMENAHSFETGRDVLASRLVSEDDDNSDSKPVRSIHELRQAGDNARFREVVDSIFEDMEDTCNSTSERCRSLAELCGKLLDFEFAYRFSEQGFDERLVNCFSNSFDVVSASLALSAYKLILNGGHASRVFSESLWARILDLPSSLLDTEDDLLTLARESYLGLSKAAQASIRAVRSHLHLAMDSSWPCLSPRLLALACTQSSLLVLRERGHAIRPISPAFLDKLVDLMVVNTPKDLDGPLSGDRFQFLDLVFSILENSSVISESFDSDHCRCFRRLSQLYRLLSLDHQGHNRQIRLAYIRVILNLTNKELTLCDSFAIPELLSGLVRIVTRESCEISKCSHDNENSALTAVILALGTLINLAEKTELSRAILLHSNGRTGPFLHQLLEQFSCSVNSMDQAHSVPEVHENVVAGYLSILLLTVCLDEQALLQVKDSLKGGGLDLVLSTAEKFLQYHKEVEKDTRTLEAWEQEDSRLTARLEHIINQVRWLEGTANGDVAS